MKKIGLVGGIGPASTVEYYKGIIEGCRKNSTSDAYPDIVINSIDMTEMLSYVAQGDTKNLISFIAQAVRDLEHAGAQIAAIASNTPHIVFDDVQTESNVPLVSIIEETCLFAREKDCAKVLILGTLFTMQSGMYEAALKRYGMAAITPDPETQQVIQNIIFPKLKDGIVDPDDKEKLLTICNQTIATYGVDAVVLGCTELPLMIKQNDLDITVLDTAQIHIDAIVGYAAKYQY